MMQIKVLVAGLFLMLVLAFSLEAQAPVSQRHIIRPASLSEVRIQDPFWSPRFKVWTTKTVYDVFDKLEGKYVPDRYDLIEEERKLGRTRNAFLNFDRVAKGDRDTKGHDGPPWYDGLVYETIRGAADLLRQYPDERLEGKIDAYIDRIAAAQAADPDGYLNTYTTLERPDQRWGTHGGDDKWQHDIYNSGMLVEAAVHYYQATGKTKLLNVAVQLSNYICTQIGPAPRLNVIPGHAGPEEAMLKLYWLFKRNPELKRDMSVPVDEDQYYGMARFWIEDRGHYSDADGSHARKSDGAYNQDQLPVLRQTTLEGHAVRATLLATGVAAMALENAEPAYMHTAIRYWDNMTGKRMFVTGGEGAIADQEKFGPDYFLPESAYLETCASIGAAFFCQRMNQLLADGKYMDEFERVLYNNMLSGVSLSGDHYFYENPLKATDHRRWAWHSCPCCPPMFLKLVSAMPGYIYATDPAGIYVNLFIGSEYKATLGKKEKVTLTQTTKYPWEGTVQIQVDPETASNFVIRVRIPGWAQSKENYFGLYYSRVTEPVSLEVNGRPMEVRPVKGYVSIQRRWKKGDKITLRLPMEPRMIFPNDSVQTVKGKVAMASGPVIYSLEGMDNPDLKNLHVSRDQSMSLTFKPALLGGINIITGQARGKNDQHTSFTAIPFFALANREVSPYTVWVPVQD